MAKEVTGFIKLQIKGGAANPSPPVGPALGSKGLNIMDFCKQFNARTQDSAGKVLPVVITVYSDKSFSFEVKQPPVAVQLKEAAKISSGSAEPNRKKVATITWDQVKTIAASKMPDMNAFTLKSAITREMSKLTKNQKTVMAKYDPAKQYKLSEACEIVKDVTFTKFDASVELAVNLGVDPRKANQMVRGVVTLPHGTGKQTRVLVLCTPDKETEAKEAGADYVGLDEYIDKIKGGWTDVDVIICTPSVMAKVGAIGRILGPRGLMPNPKTGTVTMEIGKAVKEVKAGKIDFKVDKTGIVHAAIGKASFTAQQICDNAQELISAIMKLKPQTLKGTYLISASICTTMSPGVSLDIKSFSSAD